MFDESSSLTYTESIDFVDQFCIDRPQIGTIQWRSRFSVVSITRSNEDRYRSYLEERQRTIDRFHFLYTQPLKVDEKLSLDSFQLLRPLGKGGYGSVFLAYHSERKEYLALKAIQKSDLIENNEEQSIISERQYVFALQHPNIVQFLTSFKDNDYVYIGLEWLPGGDLYSLMSCQIFTELEAQFYAGQILMALDYLHGCKLVYRDLKPENIVLTNRGYIKLIDLGLAKIIRGYSKTFCGTPHYIAPEVILHRPYTTSPDYWSLGIVIHEMVTGDAPYDRTHRMHSDTYDDADDSVDRTISDTFIDDHSMSTIVNETSDVIRASSRHYNMYRRIIHGCSTLHLNNLSEHCNALINALLRHRIEERLGCGQRAARDVMEHPWFQSIDFEILYRQSYVAPYLPIRQSFLSNRSSNEKILQLTANKADRKHFDHF